MLAPRARAIEAFDGRLQLHGFGEVQMRALSRNLDEDVDLAQWYNVLNLEFEADVAPDGWGPMDLVEAFVRVEARYDCVWTRGCGTMRSADTYGDRAKKLPPRLSDARDPDFSGEIPPTPPGTFTPRTTVNRDAFGRTTESVPRIGDSRPANLQPTYIFLTDITSRPRTARDRGLRRRPVAAFPTLPDGVTPTPTPAFQAAFDQLGDDFFIHEPVPREGLQGFDLLFRQRGADNVVGTADDPAVYTFGPILNVGDPYSWALAKMAGPPGGSGTQLIGPWRPDNFIQPNALLKSRANPFRGAFAVVTGAYRGSDPLDPRLQDLKEALLAIGTPRALNSVPALTTSRPDDVTGDRFAGDFSGVIPCIDPATREAEEQRTGSNPENLAQVLTQPNCVPNLVALETNMGSPENRSQPLSNVRVAFDTGSFGGARFELRAGGAGELPMRPAPDLSNLAPASANPKDLLAQGLYIPSRGLQRELAKGDFDSIDFNYDQLERSFNRGQSQEQTGELKEAYLDIEWLDSRLWTRIGKQSIVWGKTELFRTTDQFNPQDLALASLPSLEESRIALWAFRAVYSLYDVGPLEDVRLEFATNFDEFQPADLGAAGEPFTLDVIGSLTSGIFFHSVTGVGVAGIDRPDNPWDNIKGLEVGGRIEWRWDRFSFALTDFYGFDDFPFIDRIWTYSKTNDLFTNRPLVGGIQATGFASRCQSAALDRDGDGVIDTYADPYNPGGDPNAPARSITSSKNVQAYTTFGIGAQPDCLKGGGAPGFDNADPFFGGAQNALQFHHANQQIFAWICSTTVGIGAALDAGSCAWNIFGSPAPLAAGLIESTFAEAITAVSSGDPDVRNKNFVGVVNTNLKPSFNPLARVPLTPTNKDPGPLNPNCERDPDAFDPFDECARWDGVITAIQRQFNRVVDVPTTHTILLTGQFLDDVNRVRNDLGLGDLPTDPGTGAGVVTSSCTFPVGAETRRRTVVDLFGGTDGQNIFLAGIGGVGNLERSLPGICALATDLFNPDPDFGLNAQDLLTLDSTLSNFQKALLGCGPFYGTRCDSSTPLEVIPSDPNDPIVVDSVDALNAEIDAFFQEGGGMDFLNTEASALEQSWPGIEGTAPRGAELQRDIYWTTLGQRRQPGTARVDDPSGIYEQGREFGPHCTRPNGKGGLTTLPGCRGIETILVTRNPVDAEIISIQIAFEQDYRPSVDGCLVGGGANRNDTVNAIGNIGGVDVFLAAGANGYVPDLGEIQECHQSSRHKTGDFSTFSTQEIGSNWLWHPFAGCLSEDRAGKVGNFGDNNIDRGDPDNDDDVRFGDCGEIVDVNGLLGNPGEIVSRSFLQRFIIEDQNGNLVLADLDGNGVVDIEDEFLGRLERADCVEQTALGGPCEEVAVSTAQLFQNELAVVSWNFLMFLVTTSCSESNEGEGNVRAKQECFDPEAPLRADKCSYNAPHLCFNVKGFLSVAGVSRNTVLAGGNGQFGRRTFIWHSGGEIALRYEKRNVLGFSMDFAEDVTKSNWGMEFTWIEGVPFTDNDSFTNITKSDVLNLTVSVDRPTFVNFLNANRTFFFNSQWFFQYVTDYENSFPSNGPWNILFTFAVFTGYFQDRLLPTFVSVFDVQSESGGFLPSVAYRFTEAFSATIGVNIFFGRTQFTDMPVNEIAPASNRAPGFGDPSVAYQDGVDNLLSLVRRRDEFYLRLRWTF